MPECEHELRAERLLPSYIGSVIAVVHKILLLQHPKSIYTSLLLSKHRLGGNTSGCTRPHTRIVRVQHANSTHIGVPDHKLDDIRSLRKAAASKRAVLHTIGATWVHPASTHPPRYAKHVYLGISVARSCSTHARACLGILAPVAWLQQALHAHRYTRPSPQAGAMRIIN